MRYVCPLNQNKIDKAQGGKERAQLQLKLENMNEKLWWFGKKKTFSEKICLQASILFTNIAHAFSGNSIILKQQTDGNAIGCLKIMVSRKEPLSF